MILRDIDLHLAYLEDIDEWRRLNGLFQDQTSCIEEMFIRLLGTYRNDYCKKLNINCGENVSEKIEPNIDGFAETTIRFDHSKFVQGDDYLKKTMTLDAIMKALSIVSKLQGWDMQPFNTVAERIASLQYRNEWYWKKKSLSPNKKYVAQIYCEQDTERINLSLVINSKDKKESFKQFILTEKPSSWYYAKYLGDIYWLSANHIEIKDRWSGEVFFSTDVF